MSRTSKIVVAPRGSTRGEVAIQEFANSNLPSEQLRKRAVPLLTSKELLRIVWGLPPEDRTKFVDKVDQAYPTVDPQNAKFVTALGNVCSAIEWLPTSAVLSAGLEKRGDIAVASGGLTDVWRGQYNGTQVAVKAFRIYPAQNLKEAKEILWKRVPMWRKLSHENILSFRGVNMTLFGLALVYDWGQNGNISQYLVSHPSASRPSLLFGVAKGLRYLHSLDVTHGDLKEANVVVDGRGHPRLTEYGLESLNSNPTLAGKISRWPAPEIIDLSHDDDGMPVTESKPADVFAFAMFVVEVLTRKAPFDGQQPAMVAERIRSGERPRMPRNGQGVGLTGKMWKLLESCWHQNPKERPMMEEVVRRWEAFVEPSDDDNTTIKKPQPTADPVSGTSRPRGITEAVHHPWMGAGVVPPRTMSEAVRSRTASVATQPGTDTETVPPQRKPAALKSQTQSDAPLRRTLKRRKKWFCGLI